MKAPAQITVVEASAGSGKTRLLTLHFVALLLGSRPPAPQKILAITFTNDAAGEMKQRILEWLKKAALKDKKIISEIKNHAPALFGRVSDGKIAAAAEANISRILENYLDLNVHTIDSFINSVAVSSSVEMDLPPRYEIVTDIESHIAFVVEEILSRAGADAEAGIFRRFLESYLNIEEEKTWNPKKTVLSNAAFLYEQENMRGKTFEPSRASAGFSSRKQALIEQCLAEAREVGDKRSREPMIRNLSAGRLDELSESQIERFSPGVRLRLADYFTALARARFDTYIEMHGLFRAALENHKRRGRVVFISDLNSKIASYVSADRVPSIYFMLGDRVEHFLIDEFQDTSEIQWRNLLPLVENSVAAGGTLFYVGDKKQALYRWRGGRAELFDSAAESCPSPAAKEFLRKNFRSRKNIVDFVNASFSVANLAKLGLDEALLAHYANSSQEPGAEDKKEGGAVIVRKISAAGKEELDDILKDMILNDVAELSSGGKPFGLGDIAVLVRKNDDVKKITTWLMSAGYPVISETTASLRENAPVIEVINFLRIMDMPSDNLAFAAFVSGELFREFCGLSSADIADFLENNRPVAAPLSELFRRHRGDVWEKHIAPFVEMSRFMAPYDLTASFLKDYAARERMPDYEIYFMRLLEILKERESSEENSLKDFLDYWVSGPARDFEVALPERLAAVKVSTIHKSKGLSYPAVIMPFAPASKKTDRAVVENSVLALSGTVSRYAKFSSDVAGLAERISTEELLDDVNVAYVGATRAGEELRLILLETARSPNPFVAVFNPQEPSVPRPGISHISAPAFSASSDVGRSSPSFPSAANARVKKWWEKIAREKTDLGALFDERRRAVIARGEVTHLALSKIEGPVEREDVADVVRAAVAAAAREKFYAGRTDEIAEKITALFDVPEFADWFSSRGFNEKEIVDDAGRLIRMDRFVTVGGGIFIIEYKTGEEYDEKHAAQAARYKNCASQIYPEAKIYCRLVYVDEKHIVAL